METSNGNLRVRMLLKRIFEKPRLFNLSAVIGVILATFLFTSLLTADAADNHVNAQELLVITTTSTEVSTTEKKETTTTTSTTTTTTTTAKTTTTSTSTTSTSATTLETTNVVTTEMIEEENFVEEVEAEELETDCSEEPSSEPETEADAEVSSEDNLEESVNCEEDSVRTRPEITSGQYRLASMMANEGGASDITCIRTAIGFMNRIHNSQFMYGSIEKVWGYCFSTPSQHHLDLAAQVIEAYNCSDSQWYDYCVEHNLTDKTVYHHNGTTVQWFEQPGGFVEYGDTGWYRWTLLYSEGIYDHY